MNRKISFIGVGNMAGAIISGITLRKNIINWSDITLHDKYIDKLDSYKDKGANIVNDITEAVNSSDCIFLCVKPQNFSDILPCISLIPGVEAKLFVTIAAGISTKMVSDAANGAPVVRVMPNTPMLVGQGVSAVCRNDKVSDEDFEFVCNIFAATGRTVKINEDEMNRIISVSGSSPAYVFMMIKAMYLSAVEQGLVSSGTDDHGLSEKEVIDTICDVIIGSAQLMKLCDKTPDEQIQAVCSKGGTTERAVRELEKYDFYEAFSSAMKKCTERAEELGKVQSCQ